MAHTDEPQTLAIADEGDLLASLPRDYLTAALVIAFTQLDECDEDEIGAYGIEGVETPEERDHFTTTLQAVLADLGVFPPIEDEDV